LLHNQKLVITNNRSYIKQILLYAYYLWRV